MSDQFVRSDAIFIIRSNVVVVFGVQDVCKMAGVKEVHVQCISLEFARL